MTPPLSTYIALRLAESPHIINAIPVWGKKDFYGILRWAKVWEEENRTKITWLWISNEGQWKMLDQLEYQEDRKAVESRDPTATPSRGLCTFVGEEEQTILDSLKGGVSP
ncbi:MAG: hypothetical protein WC683_05135 [bacterium]